MALFAKKEQVTLKLVGMHCANCQKTVGDALRAVPGVASANVDLAFHRATVSFDPQATSVARLVEAVKRSGYDASAP